MSAAPTVRQADRLDVGPRSSPVMPSACQSGGCGGGADPRPMFPSFGRVAVNGVEIDPDAIALEIQHHPAPDAETAWREAARALAVRELLLQEARRLGVAPDLHADEDGRSQTNEDALIQALLADAVLPERAVQDECRRYYAAHAHKFRTPDLFEAAHILIEPDGTGEAAWQAAETRAFALAAEVGDDPARFALAAREQSACASARQDGSLGQIRRGELVPVVQAAIEALDEGTTGRAPVRSRHGWHIVRLQRRIGGQVLPFEAVADRIADMLEARSWTVQSARYITTLAERGDVIGVTVGVDG